MNTMTAKALAAKLATPETFTLGEVAIIAKAFGVDFSELMAVTA